METTPTAIGSSTPTHPIRSSAPPPTHDASERSFLLCVQPTPYYTSRVKLGFALAVGERSMSGHQYVKRTRAWKRKGEKKKEANGTHQPDRVCRARDNGTNVVMCKAEAACSTRCTSVPAIQSDGDRSIRRGACHGNGMRYNRHELEF
jgi:hypothetical protein